MTSKYHSNNRPREKRKSLSLQMTAKCNSLVLKIKQEGSLLPRGNFNTFVTPATFVRAKSSFFFRHARIFSLLLLFLINAYVRIYVHVILTTGLILEENFSMVYPYCLVALDDQNKRTNAVQCASVKPSWQEELTFQVSVQQWVLSNLRIQVRWGRCFRC